MSFSRLGAERVRYGGRFWARKTISKSKTSVFGLPLLPHHSTPLPSKSLHQAWVYHMLMPRWFGNTGWLLFEGRVPDEEAISREDVGALPKCWTIDSGYVGSSSFAA